MSLKCVIIDDEPIGSEIIRSYIAEIPFLDVTAVFSNAEEGLEYLKATGVDVLFLDIEMKGMTGIELYRSLPVQPALIFTTAYPSHAITGYDLDAVDYLLKPISQERFEKAIDKLFLKIDAASQSGKKKSALPTFFFIKVGGERVKIEYKSIVYIEGLENYVRIFCDNESYIAASTMKNIEKILLPYGFLRIHRSYIVNPEKIKRIRNNCITLPNKELTCGKNYKASIVEWLMEYASI